MDSNLKETVKIDVSSLVKEPETVKNDVKNLEEGKLAASFLANHVGEEYELTGEFVCFGREGSALFHHCLIQENREKNTIGLGHMWWQNFSNKVKGKLEKGTVLKVNGKIYQYKNTYGINVLKILE